MPAHLSRELGTCRESPPRDRGSLKAGADEGSAESPITAPARAALAALARRSGWGEGSAAASRAPPGGTAPFRATIFAKETTHYAAPRETFTPIRASVEAVAWFSDTRSRSGRTASLDAVSPEEAVCGLITGRAGGSAREAATFPSVTISLGITTGALSAGASSPPGEHFLAVPAEAQINAAGTPGRTDEGLDPWSTAPSRRLEPHPERPTGTIEIIELSTTAHDVEMILAASPDLSSSI